MRCHNRGRGQKSAGTLLPAWQAPGGDQLSG
ncbi:hypothetical protein AB6869_12925 [Rahnella rivi]